jgi:hypothetical protein
MNTVTNIGVGLTTQASNTNWTQQAQQTTILDAVNPRFLRPIILSTNGVQVIANSNNVVGINISDIIEAAVTVDPHMTWPPNINTQPLDIFDNARANANINIIATVEFPTITPITYQWQASNTNGNTWTNINAAFHPNITGFNTNTLAFTPLNIAATWNFRCIAVANSGTNTSNFSNVTTISAPTNQSVTHPAVANFNVAVTGPGSFSYLWQISTDGGTVYSNLADNSIYIGTNTNFLNIANSTGLNGFKYRCGVNNATATVNSNNATLTVA